MVVIAIAVLVAPLSSTRELLRIPLALAVAVGIAWAGYIIVGSGGCLRFYVALSVAACTVWVVSAATGAPRWAEVAVYVLVALMVMTTLYIVLRHSLFGRRAHAIDRVTGAACGYFLIGLLWVQFYLIVLAFTPDALLDGTTDAIPDRAAIVYFSLVPLTTQGYGDIAPVDPFARLIAATEGAVGTLYLAVVIAGLVGRLQGQAR